MLIYLSLPRNRFSYLVITFLHTILSESGCRIARSVITDMVRRSHGSNCVMSTEVCCATLFAGRMEFCFVCLGQCSLNQSIRSDSQHCHKQSIFHEEKHLPEIEGDTFRMAMKNYERKWPLNTSDYYYWIVTNRSSIEHPQANIALILKWIQGKTWWCTSNRNGVFGINHTPDRVTLHKKHRIEECTLMVK